MIIPVGFGQVTHNFTGDGLAYPAAVVYGIDQGSGVSVEDAAEAAHTTFAGTILELLTDDITLASTLVKYGPNDSGPSAEFIDAIPGSETGSGAACNLCYLLKKGTALGGRKGRGRMYLPGVLEDEVGSDGDIAAPHLALLATAANTFLLSMAVLNVGLVLLHTDATTPTIVTTLVPSGVAATQRRRMRR